MKNIQMTSNSKPPTEISWYYHISRAAAVQPHENPNDHFLRPSNFALQRGNVEREKLKVLKYNSKHGQRAY